MKIFYLSVFFMYLANGMIAIFVPVYLYHLNYPIWQIIIFYTLVSLSFVILSLAGARLVSRIGVKYSILLSTFFLIAYYLLLNYIDRWSIIFFVLSVEIPDFDVLLGGFPFNKAIRSRFSNRLSCNKRNICCMLFFSFDWNLINAKSR